MSMGRRSSPETMGFPEIDGSNLVWLETVPVWKFKRTGMCYERRCQGLL